MKVPAFSTWTRKLAGSKILTQPRSSSRRSFTWVGTGRRFRIELVTQSPAHGSF